jgi:HD-like signal output (HDOD) protein
MTADGRETTVQALCDLVAKDPGLAMHVLHAVNHLSLDSEEALGDPAQAVQLLGGSRMRVIAAALPTKPTNDFRAPADLADLLDVPIRQRPGLRLHL